MNKFAVKKYITMSNIDVKYKGLTSVPSDYECGDGELAAMLNLVPEDGSLKPVQPPKTLLTLPVGVRVLFIHKTASYTHYIVYDERTTDEGAPIVNGLYWVDSTETAFTPSGVKSDSYLGASPNKGQHYGMNAVGNTLLLLATDGTYYYLWKEEESKYKFLGDSLPEVTISFGLQGHPAFYCADEDEYEDNGDKTKLTFVYWFKSGDATKGNFDGQELEEEDITPFTNCVMGKLNKTIREKATEKGRFALPFLVRYALRLYDGSLIHHSAPILMTPASNSNEFVMCDAVRGDGNFMTMSVMIMACDLDYFVKDNLEAEFEDLNSDWKDIVKSVDIFVSKPIYTFNSAGQLKAPLVRSGKQLIQNTGDNGVTVFYGRIVEEGKRTTKFVRDGITTEMLNESYAYYFPWEFSSIRTAFYDGTRCDKDHVGKDSFVKGSYYQGMGQNRFLQLPMWEDGDAEKNDLNKRIAEVSTFYLLKKIETDDLVKGKRTKIDIEDDYLAALTSRETMTDDYLSHERIIARRSHAYNSRINLADIERKLFRGFKAESMRCYINTAMLTDHTQSWTYDADNELQTINLQGATYSCELNITCEISIDGATYHVTRKGSSDRALYNGYTESGVMYSYPLMDAITLLEWTESSNFPVRRKLKLQKHEFLNLAYCIIPYSVYQDWNDWAKENITGSMYGVDTSEDTPIVNASNKLYTSEVNNPFLFKASGINSIGTGRIVGISSAVKALSQGQFGQFPLYAFSTDGVWALEVSSTGTYSAKQPVTRDVCVNADSITQLDNAVLFATDRGIMLLRGSETICLTDVINGGSSLSVAKLPKISDVAAMSSFTKDDLAILPFADFSKKSRMLYDYTHQRIIVYNPSCTYAYIYSLKSKQWGMMQSTISSSVNSYPDAMAMLSDGRLVNFSGEDTEGDYKAIMVTRPLKFGIPDVHKTVSSIIQRGFFRTGHVRGVLYGSRDLFNWFVVWTSSDHYLRGFTGTPYKYFRLALLCDLADDECLTGFSVQFAPRMMNKIR